MKAVIHRCRRTKNRKEVGDGMRTAEERIASLHKRAKELRRERDEKILVGLGSASGGLFCLLLVLINGWAELSHSVSSSLMTGSSMLNERVGGYVLIAVIAFISGVIIVVLIHWYRRKSGDMEKQRRDPNNQKQGKKGENDE